MQHETPDPVREAFDAHWAAQHAFYEEMAAQACAEAPVSLVGFKPLKSEALAVHPDQIPEARQDAAQKGVPVDFDRAGRPIFTSSRQFRAYAHAYGFRHKGY